MRGSVVKIELNTDDTSPKQVRVLTPGGALLSNLIYIAAKGLNRFDVRVASGWAAGIYTVHVIDQKGKLSSQHKLLIQ